MCDTATLLPADLISAEGGGGTGLNEHFSKGLKSVIARENTHFYRFFIYSIFSCYAIKTSESQRCFFTHISNYITTMLFFFFGICSFHLGRPCNHLAWFVSRESFFSACESERSLPKGGHAALHSAHNKGHDAKCSQGQDDPDLCIHSTHAHSNPFFFFSICDSTLFCIF